MAEPHPGDRPALHVTPAAGWLNDPLGVTFRRGRYHAFHQAVPDDVEWHPSCSWGHLTSDDLITWTTHPTALAPGDDDFGCWSGDVYASPDDGSAVMFYTSVRSPDLDLGLIRTARPCDDGWTAWRKGPVVVTPPSGEGVTMFRDPAVVRDGDGWLMLVGAAHTDGRAAVLAFTSPNLDDWQYAGPFLERSSDERDPLWTGTGWECPHLLAAGGRDVLVLSVWTAGDGGHFVAAAVGGRDGPQMTVDRWSRLTYGPAHYAPTSFTDADGLPCLLFWLRGVSDGERSWAGALSIPYRMDLSGDTPVLAPHPALRATARAQAGVVGLDWAQDGRAPAGTLVLPSATGEALVRLTANGGTLRVDTPARGVEEAPLGDGPTSVLLDRGILEICTGPALIGLPVPGHVPPAGAGATVVVTAGEVTGWW